MTKVEAEILIIGGGPAGMSAALSVAGNSGRRVLVVDDNPGLGGQIWRAELGKTKSLVAQRLINKIEQNAISIINDTAIFAQNGKNSLLGEMPDGTIEFKFKKLILATGARERFLPFPNWTLPNIFGAGGLQALAKGGFSVENKKIVVAGTGALLLAVAEYLKSKGARVLLIAEQASAKKLLKFGLGLAKHPKKLAQGLALRAKLLGVSYLTNCFVNSAEGRYRLEAVNLTQNGKTRRVECNFLACGFHLVPNIEVPALLDCKIEGGLVSVDEFQQTSLENVFCAGEPTGIGGIDLSLIEGKIAGLTAIGESEKASELFSPRLKMRKFANTLNKTFELREELKKLPGAETIICRCEDVRFKNLKNYHSWREAKLQTRCGMGACQGRICGASVEFLFDWKNTSTRPPIFPVKLENLAGMRMKDE